METLMLDVSIRSAYYAPGEAVFKNFAMSLGQGELAAVVGPSGSGKSTLLRIIAGLHEGFDGSVNIAPGARLAYIPQSRCLLPWKTVLQSVVALGKLGKRPAHMEKARELIRAIGLEGLEDRYPNSLSGGQYQRVALGQAVYFEPDILLMDEPFSSLDTGSKREVQDVFRELQQRTGMAAILITHDLREADYLKGSVFELKNC